MKVCRSILVLRASTTPAARRPTTIEEIDMPSRDLSLRVSYLYALLTGIVALFTLVWLFMHPAIAVDLATLLAFALFAVLLSTFRIPIGKTGEVGLTGAVLLGAALVGGPAWGGWVGFIAGLVTGLIARPASSVGREQWASTAATALFSGGRNTLSVAIAWWAYQGLGGRRVPLSLDAAQTLAVIVLCMSYAIVRCLWLWILLFLRRMAMGQPRDGQLTPTCFLAEVLPLPTSVLVAATFVWLGWPYFLLLALLFIGLSALMRRMVESSHAQQEELTLLRMIGQIKDLIVRTPEAIVPLSNLAYQICEQFAPADKFELGLYDASYTHVHIQVSTENGTRLPPMHIPITPKWEWLSELTTTQRLEDRPQIEQLPFSLPPLGRDRTPRSALFVPIPAPIAEATASSESLSGTAVDAVATGHVEAGKQPPPPSPIGAMVLLSAQAEAFSERDAYLVTVLAAQLTPALARAGLPQGIPTASPKRR
jgi:hypothetical protein